jgi:hypothetical protein
VIHHKFSGDFKIHVSKYESGSGSVCKITHLHNACVSSSFFFFNISICVHVGATGV